MRLLAFTQGPHTEPGHAHAKSENSRSVGCVLLHVGFGEVWDLGKSGSPKFHCGHKRALARRFWGKCWTMHVGARCGGVRNSRGATGFVGMARDGEGIMGWGGVGDAM